MGGRLRGSRRYWQSEGVGATPTPTLSLASERAPERLCAQGDLAWMSLRESWGSALLTLRPKQSGTGVEW